MKSHRDCDCTIVIAIAHRLKLLIIIMKALKCKTLGVVAISCNDKCIFIYNNRTRTHITHGNITTLRTCSGKGTYIYEKIAHGKMADLAVASL